MTHYKAKTLIANELEGDVLNKLVADCEGVTCTTWKGRVVDAFSNPLMYHDDWALAGPIIEREKIRIAHNFDEHIWEAGWDCHVSGWGDTPLVAAMRCYVASKMGAEIVLIESEVE